MTAQMRQLYDPMVYDIMRERANRLGGRYVALEQAAADPAEAQEWGRRDAQLVHEVNAIDAFDEAAVRSASDDFARRFAELERLRVAAG